ncbi:hypothetical protein H8356DRAFT_1362006 [Neocallimastix lanati (nom. inval.)]|nr:hypothetical protein H8356DRAFT_1362006 [Neocallimastix sp. JGI-2020a]
MKRRIIQRYINALNIELQINSSHNHLEKELEASKLIVKHKVTIRESPFSLDIRPKRIFNEISQDMGLICPEFNTIRTQIIRSQNKQLRPGITAFEEIPGESEYYKIENDIFTDGTFYIAPKFSYQVKFSNGIVISPINFHCDFEKGISNKEEALSYNDYDRRISALIECYKNKEEKLICIGCDDDDIQLRITFSIANKLDTFPLVLCIRRLIFYHPDIQNNPIVKSSNRNRLQITKYDTYIKK